MTDLWLVSKSIFSDQFRQDFIGISGKIKQQLGISLPNHVGWAVALFFQSTFAVLMCALILEGIPKGQLWWVITGLVLLYNLFLPATMGRQNAIHISENPVQNQLWQSPHPQRKLFFAWLLAEVVLFWLHELSFQLVAFYVLVRMTSSWVIAVTLILIWFLVVSNIYMGVLYREVCKRWLAFSVVNKKHEIYYLLQCFGISLFLCLIANEVFIPLTTHPLSSDLIHIDSLPLALKALSKRSNYAKMVCDGEVLYCLSLGHLCWYRFCYSRTHFPLYKIMVFSSSDSVLPYGLEVKGFHK